MLFRVEQEVGTTGQKSGGRVAHDSVGSGLRRIGFRRETLAQVTALISAARRIPAARIAPW